MGRSLFTSLFKNAWYVSSNSDGRWVAVTDNGKKTIIILDTNTGAVITSRQLKDRHWLRGVSVDISDKIFVCGPNIVVLSNDLKDEHVLFSKRYTVPHAIAYDKKKHQLIISHDGFNDYVICLQLS